MASALVGPAVAIPGVAVSWHDLRQRRIPDVWVVVTALAAVVAAVAVELGENRQVGVGLIAGSVVAGAPMLVVHLVTPASLGFGDVKYAAAVGAALGVLDWRLAFGTIVVATLLGPLVSIVVHRWRRSMPLGHLIATTAVCAVGMSGRLL